MLNFSDIKLGKIVIFNEQPCVVVTCDFKKVTKGKPTKRCKMKNLVNGSVVEYNFNSGDSVEEAELHKDKASYMYDDGENYTFMNNVTYETFDLAKEMLGGKEIYLFDGLEVTISYFNGNPITVELPAKISMKIVSTMEAAKGNTVSDITKDATAENGTVLKVPGFIKEGDYVLYNTVEDQYAGRDTSKK